MDKVALPVALTWQQTSFEKKNTSLSPTSFEVYAFAIQHPKAGLPPHSYVLYIGQAGAGKGKEGACSSRAVHRIFPRQGEAKAIPHPLFPERMGRLPVLLFRTGRSEGQPNCWRVESILNDAMMPPFSVNDFTAEVRAMKRFAEMFS